MNQTELLSNNKDFLFLSLRIKPAKDPSHSQVNQQFSTFVLHWNYLKTFRNTDGYGLTPGNSDLTGL